MGATSLVSLYAIDSGPVTSSANSPKDGETPRPMVAVTSDSAEHAAPYAHAIERGNGISVVVTPGHGEEAQGVLTRATGLLLGGGGAVHPARYGQQPEALSSATPAEYDEALDALELALLESAMSMDMPVLGIDRGMHLLNVAMGGGLQQEIRGHRAGAAEPESIYHRIYISPGCKLAAIVGSGGLVRVNSRHRQGLAEAQKARALMASAYSLDDGYIEGLESPGHRWVIGVQFHPERRAEVPPHFERLFQSLVDRAGEWASVFPTVDG